MLCVLCHISHVHFLLLYKTLLWIFLGQIGGPSLCSVCYQRGLPRLVYKLDGLGPIDNRHSTNWPRHWYFLCDTWYVICDMWQVTCDMWHVMCDKRHVVGSEHSVKISAPKILTNKMFLITSLDEIHFTLLFFSFLALRLCPDDDVFTPKALNYSLGLFVRARTL